jgi:hypothetical protein
MEAKPKKKRIFFKKGSYQISILDTNEDWVSNLVKNAEAQQEKNKKLRHVDESVLDLVIRY